MRRSWVVYNASLLAFIPGFILIVGCVSQPVRERKDGSSNTKSAKASTSSKTSLDKPASASSTDRSTTSLPDITSKATSLADFMRRHKPFFDLLGKKDSYGDYLVNVQNLEKIKHNLSSLLRQNASSLVLMTNPSDDTAWFGDVIVALDKPQETVFFIGSKGDYFNAHLKDRIFGGVYVDEYGHHALLTAFYGDIDKAELCRMYWNTTRLKVTSFQIDRELNGSISASIQLPSGKKGIITRNGRRNDTVALNGKKLVALFQ